MSDRVAIAIVRGPLPEVYIAEDQETLNWVLALQMIASTPGHLLGEGLRDTLREALLEERWGDAVIEWMHANDLEIDVYSSETLYQASDVEMAHDELQFTPLFQDEQPGRS